MRRLFTRVRGRGVPRSCTWVNKVQGGLAGLAPLQALHETDWAIEDFHSDLSWWALEGYYDPELTIDVHSLFFAAVRPRFGDYKSVLAMGNGNSSFFPGVLRASSHFPTKYLFSVEANLQFGCGL
jgi:hypothetical protein